MMVIRFRDCLSIRLGFGRSPGKISSHRKSTSDCVLAALRFRAMGRIAAAAGPRGRLGASRRALRDAHDPSARSQRLAEAPREALVTTTARVAPSRTAPMAGPLTEQLQMLRIDYDPALVPEGGAQVVGECASPLSGEGRMTAEPAGRSFHEKILRKNGLLTGARARRR